jgi:hypothetical protein
MYQWEMAKERHQEQLREIGNERLVREVRANTRRFPSRLNLRHVFENVEL